RTATSSPGRPSRWTAATLILKRNVPSAWLPRCLFARALFPQACALAIFPASSRNPEENAMAVATAKKTTNGKPGPKHNIEAMRQAYYDRIAKHDMTPLWTVMDSIVTKEPVSRCVPAVWHFDDVKSLVMESGSLISAEEAKRRVLILENPALRGQSRATNTLFAGIQMILPGEVAPAHRHAAAAIRFVLDGEGAYTA